MNLITQLKETDQDFEFYPTTPEIIRHIQRMIGKGQSVLDIGAGRGDVLKAVEAEAGKLYAIEKSTALLNLLPEKVMIMGTDFFRQTLIDKPVDVIYTNPPYSVFETWIEKTILESNAKKVIFLAPDRWVNSQRIKEAIQSRGAFTTTHGTFNFLNAERAARCAVELVQVHFKEGAKDAFSTWFDQTFPEPKKQTVEPEPETDGAGPGLVEGANLIERLEALYIQELESYIKSFRAVSELDPVLLKEVGCCRETLKGSLQAKISGLKNHYWKRLFNHLNELTDRLTYKSRNEMLKTLFEHSAADFTASNAYAVVLWAIRNANKYMDSQILDMYKRLSNPESVKAYKSNRHFTSDSFRFYQGENTHYRLDYRIVSQCRAFDGFDVKWNTCKRIEYRCQEFFNDIRTLGLTLGYAVEPIEGMDDWTPGTERDFLYYTGDDFETFMSIRVFKNGNAHIKFNRSFLLKLNIEAARLLKWVISPKEAAQEMNEPEADCLKTWNQNFRIELNTARLLGE